MKWYTETWLQVFKNLLDGKPKEIFLRHVDGPGHIADKKPITLLRSQDSGKFVQLRISLI